MCKFHKLFLLFTTMLLQIGAYDSWDQQGVLEVLASLGWNRVRVIDHSTNMTDFVKSAAKIGE